MDNVMNEERHTDSHGFEGIKVTQRPAISPVPRSPQGPGHSLLLQTAASCQGNVPLTNQCPH